jgi:hypothetical protein
MIIITLPPGAREKDLFNRKGLKAIAKVSKLKHCYSVFCDLCVKHSVPIAIGICG